MIKILRTMALIVPIMILVISVGMSYATNLVANGSFERPDFPGVGTYGDGPLGSWNVSIAASNMGIFRQGSFPKANVTDGRQAIDLGMAGYGTGNSIFQTLATIAGQKYNLSFDWGSEYDWGTKALVTVGSLNETLIDDPGNSLWLQHSSSFNFIAYGNDVLTFTDISGGTFPKSALAGFVLDNVVVESHINPEPSTFALLGIGICALFGYGWRRKRKN